jgi:predicted benzoate:H+ symporter BenE
MSEYTGETALVEALRDRRRNTAALLSVVVTLAVAALIGTNVAYYTAGLIVFSIWMIWFVLASIEWLKRADF